MNSWEVAEGVGDGVDHLAVRPYSDLEGLVYGVREEVDLDFFSERGIGYLLSHG